MSYNQDPRMPYYGGQQRAMTEGEKLAEKLERQRHEGWPVWAIELERRIDALQRTLDERYK